eukprot:1584086-Amphidinium_carterae.1
MMTFGAVLNAGREIINKHESALKKMKPVKLDLGGHICVELPGACQTSNRMATASNSNPNNPKRINSNKLHKLTD